MRKRIKDAATAAFRDNSKLSNMAAEDRETAAQFYEEIAGNTIGTSADLARLYNLERARFLRGEIPRIASTARGFAQTIEHSGEV